MNFRLMFRLIGVLLMVEGVAMSVATVIAIISNGDDMRALAISSLICIIPGLTAFFLSSGYSRTLMRREGFLAVTFSWVLISFAGCLPFVLSGYIPHLTDAFFETMSGFTTTGASIVDNIETFPRGLLFWRSMTQWLGGMGIIVLAISFLPGAGIGGMQLFNAESPGISVDKVSPRIYQTARKVWWIYVFFTLLETLLLMAGGMSWFDSICHSFSTMATGGFSTKHASIAHFQTPYIEYVITFFMIIAGSNFALLFLTIIGKPLKLFRDEEFRDYIFFILGFTVLIFAGLLITSDAGIEESFRNSLFTVVSIITTTGFVSADYLLWVPVLTILVFAIFFFGSSTGSTGGGIKIMRIIILLKNSYYELRRIIHPNAVIPVRFNKHCVSPKIVNNILAFFMFYVSIFFISSILLMIVVPDLATSMGAVASCMGNIGPGLGTVGPAFTYSHIPDVGKWFLSFLMVLGRLELLTVLVIFSPSFWKE